ncbi:prolipoprotein diacylglyceryl transferase [Portibacter marinus]|uniref:prolipoprotein diacylglyceryl transferase n=1 Tax=Portibacter marinus TaxID=2898660 RepID=UPI001F330B31|nr:prolipoprotein diacylglyceryl transferase [Portibacter marinus]
MLNLAITWGPDPVIFNLFGAMPIRYYSLLFASGLFIGYLIVKRMYKKEGLPLDNLDTLAFYIFVATVLGARLGHCLFYEPEYYLKHPLEMLLPFTMSGGEFRYTGFQGLASHGGILGVFIAIWLYCRKTKEPFWGVLDKVAVAGSLTGAFIRLGNFMNSEILGKATGNEYGVIFTRVDNVVRHPAQLYESVAYFAIFITLFILYKSKKFNPGKGFIFGLFFTLLFAARFLIEFFKINQVAFEEGMAFNMGQLLSIPFMIGGIIVMILKRK